MVASFAPCCLSVGWLGLALELMMNLWLCTSGKDNRMSTMEASVDQALYSSPEISLLQRSYDMMSIGPGHSWVALTQFASPAV